MQGSRWTPEHPVLASLSMLINGEQVERRNMAIKPTASILHGKPSMRQDLIVGVVESRWSERLHGRQGPMVGIEQGLILPW